MRRRLSGEVTSTGGGGEHSEAGDGRPVDRGVWTAKTVKRPRQQPAHPQYANYWAPLTRKRHPMPHPAQPQHTNYWAPRTRKRHQREHRPQRPTASSDPTQHAKGRTSDCPGPRKGATTRRNVTQGGQRPKNLQSTSIFGPAEDNFLMWGGGAGSAVGNALYDASGRRTRRRGPTRRGCTTRRTVSYKVSYSTNTVRHSTT